MSGAFWYVSLHHWSQVQRWQAKAFCQDSWPCIASPWEPLETSEAQATLPTNGPFKRSRFAQLLFFLSSRSSDWHYKALAFHTLWWAVWKSNDLYVAALLNGEMLFWSARFWSIPIRSFRGCTINQILITILASHDQICMIERYFKCIILQKAVIMSLCNNKTCFGSNQQIIVIINCDLDIDKK